MSLHDYVSQSREWADSLKDGARSMQTVVLGNESADLDSVASSLVYGYYLWKVHEVHSIPLINVCREDFELRPDIRHALSDAGIPEGSLIFRGEIDIASWYDCGFLSLFLVDHNALTKPFTQYGSSVKGIIDHHTDEGRYTDSILDTRIIELVGSTCTLLGEICEQKSLLTTEVARLLVSAILIDTFNLEPAQERTTPKDTRIVEKCLNLVAKGKEEELRAQLYSTLFTLKNDTSTLSLNATLRKDFKAFSMAGTSVGIAAVFEPALRLVNKEVSFVQGCTTFARDRGVDVLLILGAIGTDNGGQQRELIAVATNANDVGYSTAYDKCVDFILRTPSLKATRIESGSDDPAFSLFSSANPALSRKKFSPLLEKFFAEEAEKAPATGEFLDAFTREGQPSGLSYHRNIIHRLGIWHSVVHMWIFAEDKQTLLLQKRSATKDTYPNRWDISSAGHQSAGDPRLISCQREAFEELGISLDEHCLEYLYTHKTSKLDKGSNKQDNEFQHVYLITLQNEIPVSAFTFQESEVTDARWMNFRDVLVEYGRAEETGEFIPQIGGQFATLFDTLEARYSDEGRATAKRRREEFNQKFVPVSVRADISSLSVGEVKCCKALIKAAKQVDIIFAEQMNVKGASLFSHLSNSPEDISQAYRICKGLHDTLTNSILIDTSLNPFFPGLRVNGVAYSTRIPTNSSRSIRTYPTDASRGELTAWESAGNEGVMVDPVTVIERDPITGTLTPRKYTEVYRPLLERVAESLREASGFVEGTPLSKFMLQRAHELLEGSYEEGDIQWISLDSSIDLTIGPYETYLDTLFGQKATYEAVVAVRCPKETALLRAISDSLPKLSCRLPVDSQFACPVHGCSPIRVADLLYAGGDSSSPISIAFNLPNDSRITEKYGTAQVLLRNLMQEKFNLIVVPINDLLIIPPQRGSVSFDAFFSHVLCHEMSHGIGPHIVKSTGQTVREALQEVHSALEEAKADICGLLLMSWLIEDGLLDASLAPKMLPTFLAGCFRTMRQGLDNAHGKAEALIFTYLIAHGAFTVHRDNGDVQFSVDEEKAPSVIKLLASEILNIQGAGDKDKAMKLFDQYAPEGATMEALNIVARAAISVDVVPLYTTAEALEAA